MRLGLVLGAAPAAGLGAPDARATSVLRALAPPGTALGLEYDVQRRDRYGRDLVYAYLADGRMVNVELARAGVAVIGIYPPNVRYVEVIRAAVAEAREARRGLWSGSAFDCAPADFRRGRCDD
ncbi:MAG: thermonuclease family protein [Gemmatimonadaceae bacterium]